MKDETLNIVHLSLFHCSLFYPSSFLIHTSFYALTAFLRASRTIAAAAFNFAVSASMFFF